MKSYAIIMLAALAAADVTHNLKDMTNITIENIGGTESRVSDYWTG